MLNVNQSYRPPFWLKVRKEYVLDNLSELMNYMRRFEYNSTQPSDNEDFDISLDCMIQLASDLGKIVRETDMWDIPHIEIDQTTFLRLLGAIVLSSMKKGVTPHNELLLLVDFIILACGQRKREELEGLWKIAMACITGRSIDRLHIAWSDIISESEFAQGVFIHKLAQTEFAKPENDSTYYCEGKGLMVIQPGHLVEIAAMNKRSYSKSAVHSSLTLGQTVSIMAHSGETERLTTFDQIYTNMLGTFNAMSQVTPSPEPKCLDYHPGDTLQVRITEVSGESIYAESIDPRYNKITGRVNLRTHHQYRISTENIIQYFRKGDTLWVERDDSYAAKFNLNNTLESFYRHEATEICATTVRAVFHADFYTGTQWVTENGIRIFVNDQQLDKITDECRQQLDTALDDNLAMIMLVYDKPSCSADGTRFTTYCTPVRIDECEETFTVKNADDCFLDRFLAYSENMAPVHSDDSLLWIRIDNDVCRVLSHITDRIAETTSLTSIQYLGHLSTAAMLCRLADRQRDAEWMLHKISYLSRIVDFAHNKEPRRLTHPEILNGIPGVESRERIIDSLTEYKNPGILVSLSTSVRHTDTLSRVATLVKASNDLAGTIDPSELNNIKIEIARSLDVDDEFEPITNDRTFYGTESVSLEFKMSAVFPPANRRVNESTISDPQRQKWAILKTVCGFLNSASGGELLIGVNDSGYATGVEDDMKELVRLQEIPAEDIDHYRLYLQRIIDFAFKEMNGNARSTDIVALNVTYTPETSPEGKQLMRIHVSPYPYDVVEFAASNRPDDYADSYVRRSGRTLPLNNELKIEIEKQKIENNRSTNSQIITLRHSIKDHSVVKLLSYSSATGVSDRLVEVYKIWENRDLIYGYDRDRNEGRLFKISRCEGVEDTGTKWKNYRCDSNIEIDPFGMRINPASASTIELALTGYARQILIEEYPDAQAFIEPTIGHDKTRHPYTMKCNISSYEGISRFCMGLLDEIVVKQDTSLRNTLKRKAHAIIDSNF